MQTQNPSRLASILQEIKHERDRQEQLLRAGRFSYTCANPDIPVGGKLCVLAEEFGEVSKLACKLYDPQPGDNESALELEMRKELIQLAAVAVAWIEAIDSDYA
jgi:hypothetical protein